MDRRILHLRVQGLSAWVEQRDHPHLRGKPVVVLRAVVRPTNHPGVTPPDGGRPPGGAHPMAEVVGHASSEAHKLGVRPGMSLKDALLRCPGLVVLPPDPPKYRRASQQVHAILSDFTHRIEATSLEACFGDLGANAVAASGWAPASLAVARRVKERVRGEVGLACSVGVAPLKFVAQLASEGAPGGVAVIAPDQVLAFLHPQPVSQLQGVGKVTARRLAEHGVRTVGDLAKLSEAGATTLLGRSGASLWRMARGEESRPVSTDRGRRSRAAERTFAVDVVDRVVLERSLERQVRELAAELATAGERVRTVTVKIRHSDFETVTRARTLDCATRDPAKLWGVARALLADRTDLGRRGTRLVGVSFTGISADPTGGSVTR